MAASLVLAVGAAYQWIQRVDAAAGGGEAGPLGVVRGVGAQPRRQRGRHASAYVEPVIKSWTWWQSGGFEFGHRPAHRRARRDAAAARHVHLAARADLLARVRPRRPPLHPLLRRAHAVLAPACSSMVLAENMVQLILGWEIMGLCSFMLIGHWWEERGQQPRPRSRRSSPCASATSACSSAPRSSSSAPAVAQRSRHRTASAIQAHRRLGAQRRQPRPCCCGRRSRCSSPASARAASSRCTPGCPTRWPARRPCRRCCTPRRWSWPACSSSPASTRCSTTGFEINATGSTSTSSR